MSSNGRAVFRFHLWVISHYQDTFPKLQKVFLIIVTKTLKSRKWMNSSSVPNDDRQNYLLLVEPFYWLKVRYQYIPPTSYSEMSFDNLFNNVF